MVNTLMKSMKMMTDVLILTLFFISIFALIGLQLFPGKLRSRCVKLNGNRTFEESWLNDTNNFAKHGQEEIICGNDTTSW